MNKPLPINKELSLDVARMIEAKPRACWKNGVLALVYLAHRPGDPPLYVEGWVVDKKRGRAFEHGWLALNGQIVEPTLILTRADDLRNGRYIYLAGIRYTMDDVYRQIEIQHERAGDEGNGDIHLPFALWNVEAGALANEDYRQAWRVAFETAMDIQIAKLKENSHEP